MKYGCIGEHLKHSFSKEIHNALADYEYEICELTPSEVCEFAKKKDFRAINVTIPYKELIMPYLDYIDGHAREIGATNTVVNRDGKLYGYNTDFYGMTSLLAHAGITVSGKKVVILGTGGTSKTSEAVVRALGARSVLKVSRTKKDNSVSYEELYESHRNAEIIINTTPVGMFPDTLNSPIDISKFDSLTGVIDAIYNPLRSKLISDALERKIPAEGGLYMLVAQGVRASEIFTDSTYPDGELLRVYNKTLKDKENIVLIGMPASGKSTVGEILANRLSRKLIDTDKLIEERLGKSIPEIFKLYGEEEFRKAETEAVYEASKITGAVIATGGGAPMKAENVRALKQNGRLYFIDRPLKDLVPTSDRPLAKSKEDIEKRYAERYPTYTATADTVINANCDAVSVARKIEEDFYS